MVSELDVIPATIMYYETDFATGVFTTKEFGASMSDGIDADGPQNDGTIGRNTYGFDTSYENDAKLSNGSSKAGLGIHGLDITESISENNSLPMGIYVTSVEMDSPAMNAGIQAGDIIVSTNDTETLTMHQLASVLNQAEPGDTGNLKIMRQTSGAYEEMAVEITFGS
jgi:PDZ domain-containing secreted protein